MRNVFCHQISDQTGTGPISQSLVLEYARDCVWKLPPDLLSDPGSV